MICQHVETQHASYDKLYTLEARGNIPYLILSSIEFTCRECTKCAYLNLSLVPVHDIHVKCDMCDMSLFSISENEFEYLLEIVENITPIQGTQYFMTRGDVDFYTEVTQ